MFMPTPEARRSPRVAYHTAVELVAQSDDGDDDTASRTLSGEALDLGAGGMRVAVAERVPIGSPLTCRLTLDGHTTALHGRVVWTRANTSPTPHGMGIRFDELPGYEQRLLAHVVERSCAGYRPVQLQFDGTPSTIVARALPHATGFTLSAPLPILDRGAGVEVRLDADGDALRGRVDEIRVVEVDASRRLEVEIALGDADRARFRREARFATLGDLPPVTQLADANLRPAAASGTVVARGASVTARVLLSLAVGVAAGFALATRLPASTLVSRFELLRRMSGTTAAAALATPRAPAARAAPPSPAPALRPSPAAALQPSRFEPIDPSSPSSATAATASPVPSVSVDGHATVLRLPFAGTLEGMVARTWAQPAALALDLPGGRVPLGPGAHEVRGGSVAGLRVNARGDASLLRVHLAAPIGRYEVTAHDGVLELRLFTPE
jgi:hypothetical protein